MQSTLSSVPREMKIARTLYEAYDLQGARDYIADVMRDNSSESARHTWSSVLYMLEDIAHPLKFKPVFVPQILEGTKTATTRRRRVLMPGQRFYVSNMGVDRLYEVTGIDEASAEILCMRYYSMEACSSPIEMYNLLKNIYPEISPATVLCTHRFAEVAP